MSSGVSPSAQLLECPQGHLAVLPDPTDSDLLHCGACGGSLPVEELAEMPEESSGRTLCGAETYRNGKVLHCRMRDRLHAVSPVQSSRLHRWWNKNGKVLRWQ